MINRLFVTIMIALFCSSPLFANLQTIPLSCHTLISLFLANDEDHSQEDDHYKTPSVEKENEYDNWDEERELFDRDEDEMSPEERQAFNHHIEQALAFIKQMDPWLFARITNEGKPTEAHQEQVMEFTRLWITCQQEDYPILQLELKHMILETHLEYLIGDFHDTQTPSSKTKLKDQMFNLLQTLFEIKIKLRELEIIEIQKELEGLKAQVQEAKANKDDQIKTYLRKITNSGHTTIFEQ